MSSGQWPPGCAVADDRVERHQKLSHHRHEGNLPWSATLGEPLIEGPEGRASSDRGQGSHVQHTSHRGSSARDRPAAPHQARVAVDRGDAHESRELVAPNRAEFRQLSQKRARGDVAYSGD